MATMKSCTSTTAKIARKTYQIEKEIFLFTGIVVISFRCHALGRMRENPPCSSTHPDAVKTASLPRYTPYLIRHSRILQLETMLLESLDQFCRSHTAGGNSCHDAK